MDGRHALKMACSSGHPSQTDNYLDTKKHPKTLLRPHTAAQVSRRTAASGPSTG